MDPTLLTILLILLFATVLALMRTRKRDHCLKEFSGFHVTLVEKDGHVTWGHLDVAASGLEITYRKPIVAREGHLERSSLFYKDQFDTMDGLYRYPGGLSDEERKRRDDIIRRTANPSLMRRAGRRIRNWISMVRDALMQSVGVLIGVAKTSRPGSTVLTSQEQNLQAISGEVIGHVGNAFDPLLERHLYRQVVLEITRGGKKRKVCGWLKDYTAQFIELVDAYVNTRAERLPLRACRVGDTLDQVSVSVENRILTINNTGPHVLNVQHIEVGEWKRQIDCILPPEFLIRLPMPVGLPTESACAYIGSIDRMDIVAPRSHAIVRFGAHGTDEYRKENIPRSIMAEARPEPTVSPEDDHAEPAAVTPAS